VPFFVVYPRTATWPLWLEEVLREALLRVLLWPFAKAEPSERISKSASVLASFTHICYQICPTEIGHSI
jgi:hypothetical protein